MHWLDPPAAGISSTSSLCFRIGPGRCWLSWWPCLCGRCSLVKQVDECFHWITLCKARVSDLYVTQVGWFCVTRLLSSVSKILCLCSFTLLNIPIARITGKGLRRHVILHFQVSIWADEDDCSEGESLDVTLGDAKSCEYAEDIINQDRSLRAPVRALTAVLHNTHGLGRQSLYCNMHELMQVGLSSWYNASCRVKIAKGV